jgi:hypothetical protein
MTSTTLKSQLTASTLTYFGIAGRGEAIRLAFAIGDIEFENKKIGFGDWGALST